MKLVAAGAHFPFTLAFECGQRATTIGQLWSLLLLTNVLIFATLFPHGRHGYFCSWRYSTEMELGKLSV